MSGNRPQINLDLGHELVVDLFAGGGGTSLGIEWALGRLVDVAVNHDPDAIAVHRTNHPGTRHFCESVFRVDPVEATGNQPVGLLWASPDCTHHSKAKGGKPVSARRRGLAWVVVKWARRTRPRCIGLENVEEFQDWGPVGLEGKPCKVRKGREFKKWVAQLERLGYTVEHRLLRGCDYGSPTIRRRLFVMARRDGRPIIWPKPSHAAPDDPRVKRGTMPAYRTAAECIDWDIPTRSIFGRDKPLAKNTMTRIAKGVQRFVLDAADPFIVTCNHGGKAFRGQALDQPMRTITAAHDAHGVVIPYVAKHRQSSIGSRIDEPLHTVTAGGGTAKRPGTGGAMSLVAPILTEHANASTQRVWDAREPLRTQCANVKGGHFALVSAFLAKHYTGVCGADMRTPMPTVTTVDHNAVVAAHVINHKGSDRSARDMREPVPTICAGATHAGLVAALMAPYYGSGSGETGRDLRQPSPTVTAKDRLQLITVDIEGVEHVIVDIGMRMLQPRELFRAQGFPDTYVIDRTDDGRQLPKYVQVRLCGNSVCPHVAAALVSANFAHEKAMRGAA